MAFPVLATFAVAMTIAGFISNKVALIMFATLGWLLFGIDSMATATGHDIYYATGLVSFFVFVGVATVSGIMLWHGGQTGKEAVETPRQRHTRQHIEHRKQSEVRRQQRLDRRFMR